MQLSEQENIQKLLSSPQGKQLLRLLSRDGGTALRQAGAAVQSGDAAGAQSIMAPMLEDPQVQTLLKDLEQSMNHG
mgnify:CR=1 FL=1